MNEFSSLIAEHIPSLTEKAEAAIDLAYLGAENGLDYADAAVRECRCGVMVDGFYEYVDHLKAVFADYTLLAPTELAWGECKDGGKHEVSLDLCNKCLEYA